jgi:hypothetical protein
MNSRIAIMLAAVALAASAAAYADGEHKPKYGGVVAVVKDMEYELVAKPDSMSVFVEDHGRKVDTKGATAKLVLLTGGDKTEVALVPVGENGLGAKGMFKVSTGTKVVATITLAGKPPINARYEIK